MDMKKGLASALHTFVDYVHWEEFKVPMIIIIVKYESHLNFFRKPKHMWQLAETSHNNGVPTEKKGKIKTCKLWKEIQTARG